MPKGERKPSDLVGRDSGKGSRAVPRMLILAQALSAAGIVVRFCISQMANDFSTFNIVAILLFVVAYSAIAIAMALPLRGAWLQVRAVLAGAAVGACLYGVKVSFFGLSPQSDCPMVLLLIVLCVLFGRSVWRNGRLCHGSRIRFAYRSTCFWCIIWAILASMSVLWISLYMLRDKPETWWSAGALLVLFAASIMVYSWILARQVTSRNWWFFSRVLPQHSRDSSQNVPAIKNGNIRDERASFFLGMLADPAIYTTRIQERIFPVDSFCQIETTYQINVPSAPKQEQTSSMIERIAVPILFQKKDELTHNLSFTDIRGTKLVRLSEEEVRDELIKAIEMLLEKHGCTLPSCEVAMCARTVLGETNVGDGRRGLEAFLRNCPDPEAVQVLKGLEGQLKKVRPMCVWVTPVDAVGVTTIVVRRDVAMVPLLLQHRMRWGNVFSPLRRALTKRRLTFYFSLANADRAKSYHLTYSGPAGTYNLDSALRMVDSLSHRPTPFVCAEKVTVTNRRDLTSSRLYIKNGWGFANAALYFSCEERSRKAVHALWILAGVIFVMMLYGLSASQVQADGHQNGAFAAIFFTVMTVGTLFSVWEGIAGKHTEEWMWVGCLMTVVVSLAYFGVLVVEPGALGENDFGACICYACTAIEYGIFLTAGTVLFISVKQHGVLLKGVPLSHSSADEGNKFIDFALAWEQAQAKSEEPGIDESSLQHANVDLSRRGQYREDIRKFDGLFGLDWSDGRLIPVWSALGSLSHGCLRHPDERRILSED